MAMRIYLLGYMASGKSSFGQQLALRLGYSFIDLDLVFEERYRISIVDFFQKYDETAFRQIERSLLVETSRTENSVISTGGGTPCFYDNMHLMKISGFSVYIKWSVHALAHRLRLAKKKRPLIKDIPGQHLEEKIRQHLEERNLFYCQADLIVEADNESPDKLIERIAEGLRGFGIF
jgi:shikimate kinase